MDRLKAVTLRSLAKHGLTALAFLSFFCILPSFYLITAISLYRLAILSPKNISYLISWSACLPGFSVKSCEMVDGASEVRGAQLLAAQGNLTLEKPGQRSRI